MDQGLFCGHELGYWGLATELATQVCERVFPAVPFPEPFEGCRAMQGPYRSFITTPFLGIQPGTL